MENGSNERCVIPVAKPKTQIITLSKVAIFHDYLQFDILFQQFDSKILFILKNKENNGFGCIGI